MDRSCTYFVKLIPKYFIFLDSTVKGSDVLLLFCKYSLLLYGHTTDFYMLTSYAESMLNSLTSPNRVLGKVLKDVSAHAHCACQREH